jgi:hypothetical protein
MPLRAERLPGQSKDRMAFPTSLSVGIASTEAAPAAEMVAFRNEAPESSVTSNHVYCQFEQREAVA